MTEQPDLSSRLSTIETKVSNLEDAFSKIRTPQSWAEYAAYPEPIAGVLAQEQASYSFSEKFFKLIDAVEATIKYTASLGLRLTQGNPRHLYAAQQLVGAHITLGTWVKLAKTTVRMLEADLPDEGEQVARGFIDSLKRRDGRWTPAARYLFDEGVTLRNKLRGHTAALTEGAYESLYLHNLTRVYDSLGALAYLRHPFVRVDDVDIAGSFTQYGVRVLAGPVASKATFLSSCRIKKNTTCVWDGGKTLLGFDGLIQYRTCPLCRQEHTFFADRLTVEASKYQAYTATHELETTGLDWVAAAVAEHTRS